MELNSIDYYNHSVKITCFSKNLEICDDGYPSKEALWPTPI